MSHQSVDPNSLTAEQIKELDKQFRKPEGNLGLEVAKIMDEGNASFYTHIRTFLGVLNDNFVLELGFGSGRFLSEIIPSSENCTFYGIDCSKLMFNMASEKNKEWIERETLRLKEGYIEKMPFNDDFFDKIFTVNTIYFWDDPVICIKEIVRVLKPGGIFINGMRSKDALQSYPLGKNGFNHYNFDEVQTLFTENGLRMKECIQLEDREVDLLCLAAVKL